ncbi:hypothetical protein HGM15179_017707 [Zosterops borbonicus]|uniref:ribonuclease H n=1 Tax=Zosterops borbonicus TaxID=364589 RepID=A0A8K1G0G8_9PASS|nr:hypothetical protein HGM15179_017707 [Zosterops borbonicus]
MMGDEWGENESEGHNLLPLREVPTAPGVIGFVNVPLNTGDVRAFKKEMGRLLDDPFGVADRLDEFLGSSIYTYEDRMAILRSLFNNEEREMIKQAGIRDWDRRNPQGTPGDQKWPSSSPSWNAQTEDGRRSMVDLRNIIIQGIREAVPRGQNISKAFNECQGKEESPTEWIERLRRSLQIYSGTDPDSPVGEVLLKTQFVAKSWEDIRRKLEKIDGWQDKSLQELLREAQKVYMRREDEKQKVQAKVLVAAVKEVQRQEQASGRDMIIELGISVIVKSSDLVVKMFKLTEKDEVDINPKVWHSKGEVGRLEIDPIHIAIENPEDPIRVKQYPIPLEGRKGLKQADGSYRLVQDLRAVNARTRTRFPVVANPYTLLNRLTPEDVWYSVIDLKDAFWTCPLDEKSRDYFAFQWEDPDTNRKQQLRWTVLPQGFVESPNLFGQALEQLLTQFTPREGTKLLQCVDDLLIAGPTEESVRECTVALLNFTGDKDLKVSKSKLQFMEPEARLLELDSPEWYQIYKKGIRGKLDAKAQILAIECWRTIKVLVEVVSNHTSDALELLAKQHSQIRAFVYQNRLALDYLLAEEGGVCSRFNESECCIEIDDYGETIRGLATEIKKVAHVPVQKCNSIFQASWWDQLFGQGEWWKKLVFFITCSIAGIIFLPCLIPCFIRLIHSVVQGMQIASLPIDPEAAQGKTVSKLMKLEEDKGNGTAAAALRNLKRDKNSTQVMNPHKRTGKNVTSIWS